MIHQKDTVAEWLRRQTRIGLSAGESISVSFVSAGSNPAGVAIVLVLPSDPFLLGEKEVGGAERGGMPRSSGRWRLPPRGVEFDSVFWSDLKQHLVNLVMRHHVVISIGCHEIVCKCIDASGQQSFIHDGINGLPSRHLSNPRLADNSSPIFASPLPVTVSHPRPPHHSAFQSSKPPQILWPPATMVPRSLPGSL